MRTTPTTLATTIALVFALLSNFAKGNTEILRFRPPTAGTQLSNPSEADRNLVNAVANRENWQMMLAPNTALKLEHLQTGDTYTRGKAAERWYRLAGLEETSKYEARISYPAVFPTDFRLTLYTYQKLAEILRKRGESTVNEQEPRQTVSQNVSADLFLKVEARHAGVSHDRRRDERAEVYYDIVLETLVFGLVPPAVIPLVTAILLSVSVAYFLVVPKVWRIIERERRGKGKQM